MSAHTPGPWHYEYTRIGHTVRKSPLAMRAIAVINESENPDADARLIAAAPDLLEALQSLLSEYVAGADSGDWGNWNADDQLQVIQARSAIAKATGESHE